MSDQNFRGDIENWDELRAKSARDAAKASPDDPYRYFEAKDVLALSVRLIMIAFDFKLLRVAA